MGWAPKKQYRRHSPFKGVFYSQRNPIVRTMDILDLIGIYTITVWSACIYNYIYIYIAISRRNL